MRRLVLFGVSGLLAVGIIGMVTVSVLAAPLPPATVATSTAGLGEVSVLPIPAGTPVRSFIRRPSAILLVRDGDTWRAFANVSTHLGEPVAYNRECGCFQDGLSGAQWDKAGRPIVGPAPRGLNWYPVKVEGDAVVVDLARPGLGQLRY